MRKYFIFLILFLFYVSSSKSENVLSGFKNTIERIPLPFHIVRETAEKISNLGLKKLIFGLTSAAMVSEYYASTNSQTSENIEKC